MNLKKIGTVLTSKSAGTGPPSYEKRSYQAAVSQKLRNTALPDNTQHPQNRDIHASGGIRIYNPCKRAATGIGKNNITGSSYPNKFHNWCIVLCWK